MSYFWHTLLKLLADIEMIESMRARIKDALHDSVPFVQLKKRKKQPWRSATFNKVAD